MDKLMSARDVAKFLKLSFSTIYKLAASGEIPGFKIGDSWRFEMKEIQKLIERRTNNSKEIAKEKSKISFPVVLVYEDQNRSGTHIEKENLS